ncbi:ABC transporter permease [Mycoplasma sp. P36-A1]|uniref:ABC transporter permease n=1 Tax=Mycoplasma sp. P36-A1 TaxID=3252900 RepID=UPI003C2E659E
MKKSRLIIPIYMIWLFVLVLIPFLLMVFLTFTNAIGLDFNNIHFSLNNFKNLTSSIYLQAYINSITLSSIASLLCLLIGYPVAYFLSKMEGRKRNLMFALLILPMWSNMLLRIIGWEILFSPSSILNMFGISLDLIGSPIAIIIGMVSTYLPLMIFPIYTSLNKLDNSLVEASKDLGATTIQTFTKVIWPLSLPGVYSGITMTFLPSATNFALPERLSGGKINLIGNLINSNFGKSFNYSFGSLLSVILIIIIFVVMIFINSKDKDGDLLLW